MKKTVVAVAAALLASGALALADDLTQAELRAIGEGRAVYLRNCAACHGADLRGVVAHPRTAPDLTLIAVRDGGFDRLHVMNHIGDGSNPALGARVEPGVMPTWRLILARRGSQRNDGAAACDILRLVHYLEFMQVDADVQGSR